MLQIQYSPSLTLMVHIPYRVAAQWLSQCWLDQPVPVIPSMSIKMCHALVAAAISESRIPVVDYKLSINMLMRQLYIAVRYFYITNQLTMEEDYQVIYPPTTTTRSDYLTKTIDGELIDINKLEMNKMNSTKSIVSKREIVSIESP